ncbi:hypothetical protein [Novosphingobium sp. B1]|uniref:hypothetical protein n=1 Tax=Novosphingobium sp. B1 TaxID=1938756 RepID=UPI0009D834AF|nr:hypothetical protein [Novosphingobium sp. B1]SMC37665.1 hypothetical protein SAMN06272759_10265 [Novosphingobium sp. B1]
MEHLAPNFWNLRGQFKIAHTIDIGTHMSLVRRPSGTFVLIDAYEPEDEEREELLALTGNGDLIEAVLNVHAFHTIHCKFVHEALPHARLIGTRRHHLKMPHLNWDPSLIEDNATHSQFADLFDFSIPAGVDFIPEDESVHVSSVLVRHRESRIVHVDDTLMYLDLPGFVEKLVPGPKLRFHPKLAEGLEKRPGAADDYIRWARDLGEAWADTQIVCAAHKGIVHLDEQTFAEAMADALAQASKTLDEHRERYS